MMPFLKYMLIGFGIGAIVTPIGLIIYTLFRNTIQRRNIKKQIKAGNFLKPLDARDYNVEAWKDQIIPATQEELNNLDNKIFKREAVNKNVFTKQLKEWAESSSMQIERQDGN